MLFCNFITPSLPYYHLLPLKFCFQICKNSSTANCEVWLHPWRHQLLVEFEGVIDRIRQNHWQSLVIHTHVILQCADDADILGGNIQKVESSRINLSAAISIFYLPVQNSWIFHDFPTCINAACKFSCKVQLGNQETTELLLCGYLRNIFICYQILFFCSRKKLPQLIKCSL